MSRILTRPIQRVSSASTGRQPKGGGPDPLRLYRVDGGGHTLPTLTPHPPEAEAREGRRNRDFEASELAWEFLKQWSLP